jgi:hypothetical protein
MAVPLLGLAVAVAVRLLGLAVAVAAKTDLLVAFNILGC